MKNINLTIERGDFVGVLGRNGAGKSTLFKVITGIVTDYSGSSMVFGKNSTIQLAECISYLPEVRGLDQKAYILEHLTDLLRYKGYSKKEATKRILEWLDRFGLAKYKYQKVSTLSKGNQQKLQLIVALANNPEILILDEPFSGLDLMTIDSIWKVLKEQKKRKCTIVFSTHEINDNILDCNKFLFMKNGEIIEYGEYENIAKNYDMVLEIKNSSLDVEKVKQVIQSDQIIKRNGEYLISVKNKFMARQIFDTLEEKYCEKFWIREKTISELFREING